MKNLDDGFMITEYCNVVIVVMCFSRAAVYSLRLQGKVQPLVVCVFFFIMYKCLLLIYAQVNAYLAVLLLNCVFFLSVQIALKEKTVVVK
jgi:hypothetical protein